jgi:hypothetical protein
MVPVKCKHHLPELFDPRRVFVVGRIAGFTRDEILLTGVLPGRSGRGWFGSRTV